MNPGGPSSIQGNPPWGPLPSQCKVPSSTRRKSGRKATATAPLTCSEAAARGLGSWRLLQLLQDFDVGKVYKKKVTLINATYTINYCKLVGVDEDLRDFIHIE